MTQDEIIEMARQAGFPFNKFGLLQGDDEGEIDADKMFEAFAKLVAEKAIKDAPDYKMGHADGAAVEREACAKVCESAEEYPQYFQNTSLAAAIRNRGQA